MSGFRYTPRVSLEEVQNILTAPGRILELDTATVQGRKVTVWKNLWPNLRSAWIQATKRYRTRSYLVYEDGEAWTFDEMFLWSLRIADLLRTKYGIRKGDRVVIISLNSPEYVACWWALHILGAVPTLVNVWLQKEATNHCLTIVKPSLIFLDATTPSEAQTIPVVLINSKPREHATRYPDLAGLLEEHKSRDVSYLLEPFPEFECLPEDPSCILFTSGTTSLPKGVLTSQRAFLGNFFNNLYSTLRACLREGTPLPIGLDTSEPWPNNEGEPQKTALVPSPLFHVIGCNSSLLTQTCSGGRIILMRRWSLHKGLELMSKYDINGLAAVPSIHLDLIEAVSASGLKTLSKLTIAGTGGAAAPSTFPTEYAKIVPGVAPGQGYGLTESNAIAVSFIGADYRMRPTSTGLAPPTVDIMIADEKGNPMKPSAIGEVWIRGSNIMMGYYGDEDATRKAVTPEGWFKSGDLGYLDEEGFLYVVDRVKDIIIRGGENIHSITVEDALHTHEAVLEAAVIAVPDRRLGELVAAVVKLKEGKSVVTERHILEHVKRILPHHMVPVMVMIQKESLERNASGKIVKQQLRKNARIEWFLRSMQAGATPKL